MVFVFDLEVSYQDGILFLANTANIAHNSGDQDLIEIKLRFRMLVLEMHFNTVQFGQLGVADKADMRLEPFPNVGSTLFGSRCHRGSHRSRFGAVGTIRLSS